MRSDGKEGPANSQYGPESLNRYEWVFGKDFLSSGAQEVAHHAAQSLSLQPGDRVLDVGSGLGGTAFLFAETYAARVTGLDVLPQMIAESESRAIEKRIRDIAFILGDILTAPLPPKSFTAIYSKDSFLHIADKRLLMEKLFQSLVPGGKTFFSDYLRGTPQGSEEFESYAVGSRYALATSGEYVAALRDAGFTDVSFEDRTRRLMEILQCDAEKLQSVKSTPDALLRSDVDYLLARWELKRRCLRSGDMKWGSFSARRPSGG